MAERRMFAKTIIDSDAFLEMPATSQNLYFHLSMRADDDGFVNKPKAIMRNCGAKDDDLNILFARKFVIPFDSGIVVIKHWRINNYLRNDRYRPTVYQDEKSSLYLDENNAYSTTPQGEPLGATEPLPAIEAPTEEESDLPTVSVLKEFLHIYGIYPCNIGKAKKESLNKYYTWLTGKTITVMGSRKTVRYNHIQIRFALKKFMDDNENTEEQYIPRLPTFLGEKTLCDYVAATKSAYERFMEGKFGEGWQKVKFAYDKGGAE